MFVYWNLDQKELILSIMQPILEGIVHSQKLDSWLVSWESEGKYRHWCHQTKEGFTKNLLVVMFNPGSLSGDGKNLKRDTTLKILREVCEPAGVNPFVVNLFDYASPSSGDFFSNWANRDGDSLIYKRLEGIKFSAIILAYGDYENWGKYDKEIKERIALVKSIFSEHKEIMLPTNNSGTPKHPIIWQRQRIKPIVIKLLAEGIAKS